jgi:hypothetical protein
MMDAVNKDPALRKRWRTTAGWKHHAGDGPSLHGRAHAAYLNSAEDARAGEMAARAASRGPKRLGMRANASRRWRDASVIDQHEHVRPRRGDDRRTRKSRERRAGRGRESASPRDRPTDMIDGRSYSRREGGGPVSLSRRKQSRWVPAGACPRVG